MKLDIGDKIVCIRKTASGYPDDDRLILGETYTIKDIDIHMPNKVCVKLKGPHYYHYEFVPTECFDTRSALRDKKLKELGI